ncbi:hypothetical protein niasHT_034860 [Heterodera trifolii]|uniref:Uncharacterized protein n=1 Tax=Heterodera trifolii TaxID=157864 RepID=A0ABD2ILI3_9BILA
MRFGDVEAANPFLSKEKGKAKGKAEEGAIVSSKSKGKGKGNASASIVKNSNGGIESPKTPAKNEEEKHLKIHPCQFFDAMNGN